MANENRRATYNVSEQPVVQSESIFTTFEGEVKQLVPVCLKEPLYLIDFSPEFLCDFFVIF